MKENEVGRKPKGNAYEVGRKGQKETKFVSIFIDHY